MRHGPQIYSHRKGSVPAPAGAVLVDRTTPWGNPFSTGRRWKDCDDFEVYARERAEREPLWLDALRGRDLICWCKEHPESKVRCHAQTLIWLANRPKLSSRPALTVAEVKAMGGYDVIYIDPAWHHQNQASQGAAIDEYETIEQTQIGTLPLGELAAADCVMFCWATYPLLPDFLQTIQDWGFKYKTIAFQWVKYWGRRLNVKALHAAAAEILDIASAIEKGLITGTEHGLSVTPFIGLGNWTRANTEPCFLAVRGKPKRSHAGISQLVEEYFEQDVEEVIRAPLNRHSMKPRQVRTKIAELMGPGKAMLEMFARERGDGFDAWGNDPALGGPDVLITEADFAQSVYYTENKGRCNGG